MQIAGTNLILIMSSNLSRVLNMPILFFNICTLSNKNIFVSFFFGINIEKSIYFLLKQSILVSFAPRNKEPTVLANACKRGM
jgi:hypothetical protein